MMTSLSNMSFIYTPYLFKKSDEPRYTTAVSHFLRCACLLCSRSPLLTYQMVAMAGFSAGGILVAWTMRMILMRQNKNIANSGAVTKYPY